MIMIRSHVVHLLKNVPYQPTQCKDEQIKGTSTETAQPAVRRVISLAGEMEMLFLRYPVIAFTLRSRLWISLYNIMFHCCYVMFHYVSVTL